jgi:AraC-like DNA-binding protein
LCLTGKLTERTKNVKLLARTSRRISLGFRSTHMIAPGAGTRLGQITATDTIRSRHRTPRDFRRFDAYAIVYLLAGSGFYQDEAGADVELSAGDMILVRPSLGHRYGPHQWTEWLERYVVFEGPLFELWEASGYFDLHPPIVRVEPIHEWNAVLDRLTGDRTRGGAVPALEQVIELQHLLATVFGEDRSRESLSSADRDWLSTACSLLDAGDQANSDEPDLAAVAESMAMSYDGFRKRFRRLSGNTPARYRTEKRIERARRMIQRGTMTNREIAEALGFCDEHHLSRRFRQFVGKSPREFRQSLPLSASVNRGSPDPHPEPPRTVGEE